MEIDILREYVELVKDPSFTRAARRLNLSQSALSTHIMKLEKDLGVQLIDRGPANKVTTQGKIFLEYAVSAISYYDEGKAKCRESLDEAARTIRVHKLPAPINARDHLVKETFAYKKSHPHAVVQLVDDDQYTTLSLVRDGKVDVGIIAVGSTMQDIPTNSEEVSYFPFSREESVIWAPRSSWLAKTESLSPKDLDGYTFATIDCAIADERDRAARNFAQSYGIEYKSILRSFFSTDEFYLSDFKTNECVFGLKW